MAAAVVGMVGTMATPQTARGEPVKTAWPFAALLVAAIAGGAPLGCGSSSGGSAPAYLSRSALLDPQTCQSCHVNHYQQWTVSMHAGASDDPIFRAMNKRGQAEKRGSWAASASSAMPRWRCQGATTDGLNLDTVPKPLHGVTCFFCHSIDSVIGRPQRRGFAVGGPGDAWRLDPAQLCPRVGLRHLARPQPRRERRALRACHDIVTPGNAHIERTYYEWQHSVFRPASETRATSVT